MEITFAVDHSYLVSLYKAQYSDAMPALGLGQSHGLGNIGGIKEVHG